jgi:polyisoprenoid-binding protein YceI
MIKPRLMLQLLVLGALVLAGCSTAAQRPTPAPAKPLATAQPPASVGTPDPPSSPASAATAGPAASTGDLTRYQLVSENSEARYLVHEQLANHSLPNDAVGRTRVVSGVLVVGADGSVVAGESHFVVDLTTLQSDEDRRDRFIQRNTLETSQYPTAEFVPTEIRGLPSPLPASGAATFQLIGDMTVHGVTHPVTWDVTATLDNGQLTGTAKTQFTFEDFGMSPPSAFVVLSVEDNVRLELDFVLQRQ